MGYRYASRACFWAMVRAGRERDYLEARRRTYRRKAAQGHPTKQAAYQAGYRAGWVNGYRRGKGRAA